MGVKYVFILYLYYSSKKFSEPLKIRMGKDIFQA